MKKAAILFALPALLAACAPAAQAPSYAYSATVQASCAQALAAVAQKAPSAKPVTPGAGATAWTYYRVASVSPEQVVVQSDSGIDSSRMVGTWTCAARGNQSTLSMVGSGQPQNEMAYSFDAFFRRLDLIR